MALSNVFWLFNYCVMADGIVMTISWTVILIHTIMGNKNKWLMMVVGMLLVSSIGTVCLSYYTRQVWMIGNITHQVLLRMSFSQSI
jgi:hypothetical protein